MYETLCGLLEDAAPGVFENYQRLKGGRLPPFYNNSVTREGICDINHKNLAYYISESVYFHSRTLPSFSTHRRCIAIICLGSSFLWPSQLRFASS